MTPAKEWAENDVLQLIKQKSEESIELDFKRSDALGDSDKRKDDISKDVSAFANSIGGTLVYGIQESKDKPYRAEELSPIDPATISKEWLDQVINSRIHPRIGGITINPIELKTAHKGKVVYAVIVPQGTTAHQASDKRYYRRFNFEAKPMEDYEVRQTMARTSRPSYTLSLELCNVSRLGAQDAGRYRATIENRSDLVAHDVSAVLFIPRAFVRDQDDFMVKIDGIEYSRLASYYVPTLELRKAFLDSCPPFVPHILEFPKTVHIPTDFEIRERHALIVRVYDSFGLALTAPFRYTARGLELPEQEQAPGRTLSTIITGT